MRILAVDDDPTNLHLLETLLKAHGDEVVTASGGADALRALAAGPFDLVISDILMPGMDGFKFCREVKKNPKTKDTPFILYSATSAEGGDRELALRLGASRFVLKPEEPEKFLAIIDEVVRERKKGRVRSLETSLVGDEAFLSFYNDHLIKKLEDKALQLKDLNVRLRAEIAENNHEAVARLQAEAAYQLAEERNRDTFESAVEGMFRTTPLGHLISLNLSLARMLGSASPDAVLKIRPRARLQDFFSPAEVDGILETVATLGDVRNREITLTLPEGRKAFCLLYLRTVRDARGGALFYEGSAIEITELKRAEQDLREREAFVDAVVENIPDMLFVKDAERLRFIRLNKAAENLLGIPRGDLHGKTDADLFPEEEARFFTAKDREVLANGKLVDIPEETIHTRTRGPRVLHTKKIPILDAKGKQLYLLGISEDITERKRSEEKIVASLKEKEVLLRELYHRTKNNMQVIMSILSIHSRSLKDPRLTDVISDIRDRIMAMALVHQKLYQSRDLSSIDFRSYIEDLLGYMMESHLLPRKRISADLDIPPLALSVDTAVPCGMILQELISNVIAHAFPGDRSGTIAVRARRTGDEIEIVFKDDGVGFLEGLDVRDSGHIGLATVSDIVEHQLQGRIEFLNRDGAECRIRFRDPAGAGRI